MTYQTNPTARYQTNPTTAKGRAVAKQTRQPEGLAMGGRKNEANRPAPNEPNVAGQNKASSASTVGLAGAHLRLVDS